MMNVYLPQCNIVWEYGCPGGPAGDEYAPPVYDECKNFGTEEVIDEGVAIEGYGPPEWAKFWVCKEHCNRETLGPNVKILTPQRLPHEIEKRVQSEVALVKLRAALDSGAIKSGWAGYYENLSRWHNTDPTLRWVKDYI